MFGLKKHEMTRFSVKRKMPTYAERLEGRKKKNRIKHACKVTDTLIKMKIDQLYFAFKPQSHL